jgi:hypothetical protein
LTQSDAVGPDDLERLLVLGEARRVPHVLDREEDDEDQAERPEGDREPVDPAAVVAFRDDHRIDHYLSGRGDGRGHEQGDRGEQRGQRLPRGAHRGG